MVTIMTRTAQVDFVMGGKILDRSMPSILQINNPAALVRRNNQRTMTEEEWEQFCNDIEASMSWANHWQSCFFSKAVMIPSTLLLVSVVTLLTWATLLRSQLPDEQVHTLYNETHSTYQSNAEEVRGNYTHSRHHYYTTHHVPPVSGTDLFLENILPDICVMLVLITAVTMTISFIRLSLELQQSVTQVCNEYSHRYLPYHGITFSVQKREVSSPQNNSLNLLASPSSRPTTVLRHSRHGAQATMARKKFRPYILISIDDEEEEPSRSYQSTHNANNLLNPSYQIAAAPFFDVPPNTLLPPSNQRFAGLLVPQTLTEQD